MNTLQELEALQDAAAILENARHRVASGTTAVWRIVCDAQRHVSDRTELLLRDGDPVPTFEPQPVIPSGVFTYVETMRAMVDSVTGAKPDTSREQKGKAKP